MFICCIEDQPVKHDAYRNLLEKETSLVLSAHEIDFSRLQSVYLGGGTPSRFTETELISLVNWLVDRFQPATDTEWSIEVNPEDITEDYAATLASIGFSRISVGVQSFDDSHLKQLGRQHTAEQSRRALSLLRGVGIPNINIDLMFGYPGQTLASLRWDLKEMLAYGVQHVSIYCLTVEPKTAIFRMPLWRNWPTEQEDLIASMYEEIVTHLAAKGIAQYEISNFCHPGFESRQNLVYWQNRNYLGLGLGAHSHLAPYRWGNFRRLVDYKQALLGHLPPRELFETISPVMNGDEELMLGLRQKRGLQLETFASRHPVNLTELWWQKLEIFQQQGLLEKSATDVKLTTKGMLLADEISASLAALLSWDREGAP